MNWNKLLIIIVAFTVLLVGGCNDDEITLTKGNGETFTEDNQLVNGDNDLNTNDNDRLNMNDDVNGEINSSGGKQSSSGGKQSSSGGKQSSSGGDQSNNINTPVGQVYLCGAVNNPGVYDIYAESRLYQVIEAAGGLDEEADIDAINMAGFLEDAQQIRVPYIGEQINVEEDKRININTAGIEELCSIPGIGEARAQAIIDYRESVGGFESAEDLMQISGIKEATFNKIKNYIRVN